MKEEDRTEALRREKEIKARKSKKYLEKLIQKYSGEIKRIDKTKTEKRCE